MSSDDVTTTTTVNGKKKSKPIMEKRRRARFNASLKELQTLLVDVIKSEGIVQSKMEKADILETTVRYLKRLHKESNTGDKHSSSCCENVNEQNKFQVGSSDSVNVIERGVESSHIEEHAIKMKLSQYHHTNCEETSEQSSSTINYVDADAGTSECFIESFQTFLKQQRTNSNEKLNKSEDNAVISNTGKYIEDTEICGVVSNDSTVSDTLLYNIDLNKANEVKCTMIDNSNQYCVNPCLTGLHNLFSCSRPNDTLITQPKPSSISSNVNKDKCLESVSSCFLNQGLVSFKTLNTSATSLPECANRYPVSETSSTAQSLQVFNGIQIIPRNTSDKTIAIVVPTSMTNLYTVPGYVLPVYCSSSIYQRNTNIESMDNTKAYQEAREDPKLMIDTLEKLEPLKLKQTNLIIPSDDISSFSKQSLNRPHPYCFPKLRNKNNGDNIFSNSNLDLREHNFLNMESAMNNLVSSSSVSPKNNLKHSDISECRFPVEVAKYKTNVTETSQPLSMLSINNQQLNLNLNHSGPTCVKDLGNISDKTESIGNKEDVRLPLNSGDHVMHILPPQHNQPQADDDVWRPW